VVGGTALTLISSIRAGRGAELHRSLWGYKTSAYGIVAATIGTLAVLLAIGVVTWRKRKADDKFVLNYRRSVEKKNSGKSGDVGLTRFE
jgi:hypothetical protein